MSGADEEWVKSAMTDDTVVVELLVRLHRAPAPPRRKPPAFPLEWTIRQRRSKSASVNNNSKKPAHRGSPTTPLSWSGATSVSGGSEESSRLISNKATRSKVCFFNTKKNTSHMYMYIYIYKCIEITDFRLRRW